MLNQCCNPKHYRYKGINLPRTKCQKCLEFHDLLHAPTTHKFCPKCEQTKPIDDFSVHNTAKSKRCSQCKKCKNLSSKIRRKSLSPEIKKELSIKRKEWSSNNKEKIKKIGFTSRIKKSYNMSFEDYKNLLILQDNKCAICLMSLENVHPTTCHIDHDHKTNLVRGILCRKCNTGLGFFQDSTILLNIAIQYLDSNLSNDDLKKCNWDTYPMSMLDSE